MYVQVHRVFFRKESSFFSTNEVYVRSIIHSINRTFHSKPATEKNRNQMAKMETFHKLNFFLKEKKTQKPTSRVFVPNPHTNEQWLLLFKFEKVFMTYGRVHFCLLLLNNTS